MSAPVSKPLTLTLPQTLPLAFAAAVSGLGVPTPALAHPGSAIHDLAHGFAHPFAGADHLLAMLAVGLFASTRAPGRAWQAPALFVASLGLGAVLGVAFGGLPLDGLVAASLLGLGALLLLAPQVGNGVALPLIAAIGLLHGHAHGVEAPGAVPGYFAGFLAASALLHAIGWRLGVSLCSARGGRLLAGIGLGLAGLALSLG